MSRPLVALLSASLLLAACERASAPPPSAPATTPAASSVPPPASADLATLLGNASYIGIEAQPIQLTNGVWQGEPYDRDSASRPSMRAMREVPPVRGDLDGDRRDEAATFVALDGGGSGTFVHLAVFSLKDGKATNIATAFVGDRSRVEKATIEHGRIVVDTIESGPDDPACCPTMKARRIWTLVDGKLKEATPDAKPATP